MNFRGKTAIDRIAEAVRRNPFLVIMLEDIDEVDMLLQGSIKRAIESGRLTDSHGREAGLGNAIFIVTGDWSRTHPDNLKGCQFVDGKNLASSGFQLGLIVREKSAKRRGNSLESEDRPAKLRKETGTGFSLDLNLAVKYTEDDKTEGSHNSSDLTFEDEHELSLTTRHFSVESVPHDLASKVDGSIVFKPVDSAFIRRVIKKTISVKFSMTIEENMPIEVEDDVLDKIIGGLWHGRINVAEWIDKALTPSLDQLKKRLPWGDKSNLVARLVVESGVGNRDTSNVGVDWLPSSILV